MKKNENDFLINETNESTIITKIKDNDNLIKEPEEDIFDSFLIFKILSDIFRRSIYFVIYGI